MKRICLAAAVAMGSCFVPSHSNAAEQRAGAASQATEYASPRFLGREPSAELSSTEFVICDLKKSNADCVYTIKVRKATIYDDRSKKNYRICIAEFPYSELKLKTKRGVRNIRVKWELKPDDSALTKASDKPNEQEMAFAPGSGVVIAKRDLVISGADGGFLRYERGNDGRSVTWYAKALSKDSTKDFSGFHAAAVVVKLPEDGGRLTVCVPVDPPITNTGY